jgi:hypothetical protein
MKRFIKNYATEIPVERTLAEIQKILSDNGASAIAIEYHDGAITDIFFKVKRNGQELPFRLPAKVAGVYQALWGGKRVGIHPLRSRMATAGRADCLAHLQNLA